MQKHYYIGVDGGASKCIVRVEDASGHCLGVATSGAANIRISVESAWHAIFTALNNILAPLNLSLTDTANHFHAGIGIAGCEVVAAYQAFLQYPHGFHQLVVTSDAHTACLGAHSGQDGAIIIAGTGVVGYQIEQGKTTKVGGFGFPHDDEGGGAFIGLLAARATFKCLDGRASFSPVTKATFAHFNEDMDTFIHWASHANSSEFATLAPFVIEEAANDDTEAKVILQTAAKAIDEVALALSAQQISLQPLPYSLIGGVAPFLEPYLSEKWRARLKPMAATPEVGAIYLVRNAKG